MFCFKSSNFSGLHVDENVLNQFQDNVFSIIRGFRSFYMVPRNDEKYDTFQKHFTNRTLRWIFILFTGYTFINLPLLYKVWKKSEGFKLKLIQIVDGYGSFKSHCKTHLFKSGKKL